MQYQRIYTIKSNDHFWIKAAVTSKKELGRHPQLLETLRSRKSGEVIIGEPLRPLSSVSNQVTQKKVNRLKQKKKKTRKSTKR